MATEAAPVPLVADSLVPVMTNGDDAQRLAAEQRARVLIDRQLVAAGWVVQDMNRPGMSGDLSV